MGKGGAALSPSSGHRLARFFVYIFPIWPRFFPCGAWSQANDIYAMKHEKSSLNGKITSFMSPTHHIIRSIQKKKKNFEKLLGQQVFQNHK